MPRKNKAPIIHLNRPLYNAPSEYANNVIGERIADLRKQQKMSQATLCDELSLHGIDISRTALWKWEKGSATPSAYHLVALAKIFGIDSISLFTSSPLAPELDPVGLRKLEDYKEDLIASGRYSPAPKYMEDELIEMPVSYLSASAGPGAFLDEGNFEMVQIPKSMVPAGADFGVHVNGDSMEPVFTQDQLVWVQRTDTLRVGEVGIFIYDGQGYIKAYSEQEPDESLREVFTDSNHCVHNQPVLNSYNKAKYEPIVVSPYRFFEIAGRVLR